MRTAMFWTAVGCVMIAMNGVAAVAGPDQAARALNWFGLAMYERARAEPGNVAFSPYSIASALMMTYAGARSRTAAEMAEVLRIRDLTPDQAHEAFDRLRQSLAADLPERDPVAVANRLWIQKDYPLLPPFLSRLNTSYGAEPASADFKADAVGACAAINEWVRARTADKIRDLVSPAVVGPDTRLVLVNALYFKAPWEKPFNASQTRVEPFRLEKGGTVDASMMQLKGSFLYAETPMTQVLDLPYEHERYAMTVFLPKTNFSLEAMELELVSGDTLDWFNRLAPREVRVTFPRFTLRARCELVPVLKRMGMKTAFEPQADFSGMTERKDLWISAVVHQCYVDTNEKGSEAAAATAVTMRVMSAPPSGDPPVVFRADHPFVFMIRDRRTGAVLFLGRVANPLN